MQIQDSSQGAQAKTYTGSGPDKGANQRGGRARFVRTEEVQLNEGFHDTTQTPFAFATQNVLNNVKCCIQGNHIRKQFVFFFVFVLLFFVFFCRTKIYGQCTKTKV